MLDEYQIEKLTRFYKFWNMYNSICNKNARLITPGYTVKMLYVEILILYRKFLAFNDEEVNCLRGSLMIFMIHKFTVPKEYNLAWVESKPPPPCHLGGWLVALKRCPHLGNIYTVEMFLERICPEIVKNPLESERCGCLSHGSCASHLAMLGFMFNNRYMEWYEIEVNMFIPDKWEGDETNRKAMIREEY